VNDENQQPVTTVYLSKLDQKGSIKWYREMGGHFGNSRGCYLIIATCEMMLQDSLHKSANLREPLNAAQHGYILPMHMDQLVG
jgi:hypothetical protein